MQEYHEETMYLRF